MYGATRKDRPNLPVKDRAFFEKNGYSRQGWRGVKSLGFLASSEQIKSSLFLTDDYGATYYK